MSYLTKSKQLLEQNEDIMAAIVENMQLARLDECKQLYAVLHRNLVGLAHDLDNYPTIEHDPFSALKMFPDQIMRSDVLDSMRPAGALSLPRPPLPPPCAECEKLKVFF
jgi:hypothetical protein